MLVFVASCDETSVCLMKNKNIVDHITFSQEIHKIHGGVVPELASRSHLKNSRNYSKIFKIKLSPKIDIFTAKSGLVNRCP